MVGFSLGDLFGGKPVDTAETREMRFRIAFEQLLTCVMDLRFDDARIHLDELRAEIDDLDAITAPYRDKDEAEGS